MKKSQSSLRYLKRVATCALAVTIGATAIPAPLALASNVETTTQSVETVVEEPVEGTVVESNEDTIKDSDQSLEENTQDSTEISLDETDETQEDIEINVEEITKGTQSNVSAIETQQMAVMATTTALEELEAGTYLVPVGLKKATDTNADSMAAGSMETTALLTVKEDGTAVLQTKWKTLSVFGMTANISSLGIFQSTDYTSEEAVAQRVTGTIDSYRTTDTGDKPEKISFTIPSAMKTAGGVYVWTETDLDGMNNPAWITIDYANAQTVSLSLDKSEISLFAGDTDKVSASLPQNSLDTSALFFSSNESVATVDADGTITGVSVGTANITATANETSTSCVVTVKNKPVSLATGTYVVPVSMKKATDINSASMAASALENIAILNVAADGTSTLQTKWKTLTVFGMKGDVTGVGVFQATDYTSEEAKASLVAGTIDTYRTVNDIEQPEKISFAIPSAMQSENGVYIQMVTTVGEFQAFVAIDKQNAQKALSLDKSQLQLQIGGKDKLTAILASTGTDTKAQFSSSDTKVAVVDEEGTVTAIAAGTAVITVTANGVEETCSVTVKSKEVVVNADKTALLDALSRAKKVNNANGQYLGTTFTQLTNTIATAQAVYDNAKAVQSDVDAQVNALNNAINALQKSSISINQTQVTLYTKVGTTTLNLAANVVGDNKTVTWSSSNTDVASVSAEGVVTAKGEGSAVITATANGVSANCQVTVKEPGLSVKSSKVTVAIKGKVTLDAVADPTAKITYKTSNKKVATVSSKGVVKGIKKGTAKITVTSNGVSKTVKVTVKKQTLKLKKSSGTVTAGKTITIKATASPTGTVKYKSSNKKVATVTSKGVVKGVKAGTAKITVSINGVSKTYKVTVKKQTLKLKKSSGTVKVGKTVKIKATQSPSGKVSYQSSNEKIATVTSKGVVKGIKKGKAKIKVTCNGVSKTYKITVK